MSREQKKSGEEIPIITLVPQLGTSPRKLEEDLEYDMRILSYLTSPERMPESFKPIHYALTRADVVIKKKRFWSAIADNYLHLVNSIEGRGRLEQIKGEAALKGMFSPTETVPEKPGILQRIFDKDAVEQYERWKEKKDLGLIE